MVHSILNTSILKKISQAMICAVITVAWGASCPAASLVLGDPLSRYVRSVVNTQRLQDNLEQQDRIETPMGCAMRFLYTSLDWTQGHTQNVTWMHDVHIAIPTHMNSHGQALLVIDGGDRNSVKFDLNKILEASYLLRLPIVVLEDIPPQPMIFTDDSTAKERFEDDIVSYTFKRAVDLPHPSDLPQQGSSRSIWLNSPWQSTVYFPMVAASAGVMEEVIALSHEREDIPEIEHFIVTGASKRAWTTWLLGEFDQSPLGYQRISALIPVVIGQNMKLSFLMHILDYGRPSFALHDYIEKDMWPEMLYASKYDPLFSVLDPYQKLCYVSRIPKFMIKATGDEFFNPDAASLSFNSIPGNKALYFIPNVAHSMGLADPKMQTLLVSPFEFDSQSLDPDSTYPRAAYVFQSVIAELLEDDPKLPELQWHHNRATIDPASNAKASLDKQIVSYDVALSLSRPKQVCQAFLWQAHAPHRDFRTYHLGADRSIIPSDVLFTPTPLDIPSVSSDGVIHFSVDLEVPQQGFTAYYVEALVADSPQNAPLDSDQAADVLSTHKLVHLTTDLRVLPDRFEHGFPESLPQHKDQKSQEQV